MKKTTGNEGGPDRKVRAASFVVLLDRPGRDSPWRQVLTCPCPRLPGGGKFSTCPCPRHRFHKLKTRGHGPNSFGHVHRVSLPPRGGKFSTCPCPRHPRGGKFSTCPCPGSPVAASFQLVRVPASPWRQVFNLSVSPASIPQVKNSWPRAKFLRPPLAELYDGVEFPTAAGRATP